MAHLITSERVREEGAYFDRRAYEARVAANASAEPHDASYLEGKAEGLQEAANRLYVLARGDA